MRKKGYGSQFLCRAYDDGDASAPCAATPGGQVGVCGQVHACRVRMDDKKACANPHPSCWHAINMGLPFGTGKQ